MKRFILTLSLYVLTLGSSGINSYRYNEANVTMNDIKFSKFSGTVFEGGDFIVQGMDLATMTPFLMFTESPELGMSGDKFELEVGCKSLRWSVDEHVDLKGTLKAVGTMSHLDFFGNCTSLDGKKRWTFEISGDWALNPYYHGEEAGLRAKYLIGQSTTRYPDFTIPSYAIYDYPYLALDCKQYRGRCLQRSHPGPGFVIIDKKNDAICGILDNEGDKFIHAHPTKRIVTDTPMALVRQFFVDGYDLLECEPWWY